MTDWDSTTETQGGLFCSPLEAKWIAFHEANPSVWKHFEKLTLEAIRRDAKVGQRCIWERIRWGSEVETTGDDFKLNDNLTAYYARHFHAMHPEHDGYFKLRKVKE